MLQQRPTTRSTVHHWLVALGVSLAVVVFGPLTPTTAVPFSVAPLTLVSGPSPFAACDIFGEPGTNFLNAEVEPWVDVNPTNPRNIVGVWQQDRWSNGGARGLVAGVTHNGGRTWKRVVIPNINKCSGGVLDGINYDRASDPWLSFAPNGHLYHISLSATADLRTSALLVSKSTDGGDTWGSPTRIIETTSDFRFNDKESITADPTDPTLAYAIWDQSRFPSDNADFNALHSFAFRGDAYFSRTIDGGNTWEAPRAIFASKSNEFTIGHQIAVLPDGTLVDVFNFIKGSGLNAPGFFQAVMRSTDHGATWSAPIIAASERAVQVVDPDTGAPVRTGAGLPAIAVDAGSGILFIVWEDARFSGSAHNDVAFSMSTDGGFTWSTPVKINKTPGNAAAFTPSVHVAADGTIAVTYYDFRNNTSDPNTLGTDYWIIHCHGACFNPENWSENRITPSSFDMRTAPFARGFFVGDYEGLTSVGDTFIPFFVQTNSGNLTNRTDAFETAAGAAP